MKRIVVRIANIPKVPNVAKAASTDYATTLVEELVNLGMHEESTEDEPAVPYRVVSKKGSFLNMVQKVIKRCGYKLRPRTGEYVAPDRSLALAIYLSGVRYTTVAITPSPLPA
jgi:hypothetical protein